MLSGAAGVQRQGKRRDGSVFFLSEEDAAVKAVTIVGSLVLYGAACAYYSLRTGDMLAAGLAWNILLAALPLFLFQAVQHCRVSALRWAAKLVWVFLLPNAFYMITNLIRVPLNREWVKQLENGGAAVRALRAAARVDAVAADWRGGLFCCGAGLPGSVSV